MPDTEKIEVVPMSVVPFADKKKVQFRLRWHYTDGVEGATLGLGLDEDNWKIEDFSALTAMDPEYGVILQILRDLPFTHCDAKGLYWSSRRDQREAYEKAMAVLTKGQPLPTVHEYEVQALLNGWYPPNGWAPGTGAPPIP